LPLSRETTHTLLFRRPFVNARASSFAERDARRVDLDRSIDRSIGRKRGRWTRRRSVKTREKSFPAIDRSMAADGRETGVAAHRGASSKERRDARGANDVAVCAGTAETKSTGRRAGTTERSASENGDGDDDGGGGCDSQRRCARERDTLYYFSTFLSGCSTCFVFDARTAMDEKSKADE